MMDGQWPRERSSCFEICRKVGAESQGRSVKAGSSFAVMGLQGLIGVFALV